MNWKKNKKALADSMPEEDKTDLEQGEYSDDSEFYNVESDINQDIGEDIQARMRAHEAKQVLAGA